MICIPFDSCERVRENGARLLEADAVLPSIGSRFLGVPRKVEFHASSLLRSCQRLGSASQGPNEAAFTGARRLLARPVQRLVS